ncbi:regulator of microtubule dynamics protein 2 isoform X1 [Alosa alosa]|uniref:regulator of microtubule dynamics protein 2 isoform X1 n=1 Tax=Alosa alosa TaxID=278164 RepID=UPI0020152331|nr:regulator of microtubule dynamics protein 2 isoform X1 [Alosa alosa]
MSIISEHAWINGRVLGMSQSDSRGLVLGVLAGAAGLTLAVVWYQSRRASAGGRMVAQELYLNSNDRHVGAGMSVALAGQREVLDRLGALIQCVSELKDEVRALKTALPLLQDHVRDELQGGSRRGAESRRATPTRRRRIAEAARHEGQSSEEAESEGGYMTAMTDSEEDSEKEREAEEKEEEGEEENQEEPDELTVLLERADALHAIETERGGGLAPLLERRGQEQRDSEHSKEQSREEAVDQQQIADQQQIVNQQNIADQQQIVNQQQIADQQQIVNQQQIADQQQIVNQQQIADQQQIANQQQTVGQQQREDSAAEMGECQVTPVQRRGEVGASQDEEFKGDERNGELNRAEVGEHLRALLDRADCLHAVEEDRAAALALLLRRRPEFQQNYAFMWRLARAYADAHDKAQNREEKKDMAESGKKAGEEAITLNPNCAESHQWFAILCGQLSEYDTIQNKIKNGYLFKDHLDLAIELKPEDPLSYYLLGRWCYAVAQCTWIERKIAATLFGEPPNATVQDALQNFLKAEEICPQYSKSNLVFLAKCYKDLGQKEQAREVCNTASSIGNTTTEDDEAQKELDSLLPYL